MSLDEYLEAYRTITLKLINEIQRYGEINTLIKEREDILKSLDNLNFDKEEIKIIGNSLNLLQLEDELQNLVKKEKSKVKKQIENIKIARKANTNYNSIENKARVFNKTI